MVEIQYPTRVMNVSSDPTENKIMYHSPRLRAIKNWYVPAGYYPTAEKLVTAINDVVTLEGFEMKYDKTTQKIHLQVQDNENLPEYEQRQRVMAFSNTLNAMLGFKPEARPYGKHNVGDHPVDVHRGVHNYYVYVDMAEHVIVGDARAPLLRIVPIEYEETRATTKTVIFNSPHYIPVRKSETETIEVHITDDTGRGIPFTHGKTYVKVHFRPRQPDYLT